MTDISITGCKTPSFTENAMVRISIRTSAMPFQDFGEAQIVRFFEDHFQDTAIPFVWSPFERIEQRVMMELIPNTAMLCAL